MGTNKSMREQKLVRIGGQFVINPKEPTFEYSISKLTNFIGALKYIVPILLGFILIGLVLALTNVFVWSVFYFILGVCIFIFAVSCITFLCKKGHINYAITPKGLIKTYFETERYAYYDDVKDIKLVRSKFNKNKGTIKFKFFNGLSSQFDFYGIENVDEAYKFVSYFWNRRKNCLKFKREFDTMSFYNKEFDYVDKYGLNKLPNCYKVQFVIDDLYDSMSESGFDEFFINGREDCKEALIECCELLNLPSLTAVCKQAVSLNKQYKINENENYYEQCGQELDKLDEKFCDVDEEFDIQSMKMDYFIRNFEEFNFDIVAA